MGKAGSLFEARDKSREIRVFVNPFNQHVQMIWHEAVRKNRKTLNIVSVTKLHQHAADRVAGFKIAASV
tara:strand:+ start:313 stop:519 length:207 start_codon:yes stop_codon:yes gene_type:complete